MAVGNDNNNNNGVPRRYGTPGGIAGASGACGACAPVQQGCDDQVNFGQVIADYGGINCGISGLGLGLDPYTAVTWGNNTPKFTNNSVTIATVLQAMEEYGRTICLVPGSDNLITIPAAGFIDFDFDATTAVFGGNAVFPAFMVKYSTGSQNGVGQLTVTPQSGNVPVAIYLDESGVPAPQTVLPTWQVTVTRGSTIGRSMLLPSWLNSQSIWNYAPYKSLAGNIYGAPTSVSHVRLRAQGAVNDTVCIYPYQPEQQECKAARATLVASVLILGTAHVSMNRLADAARDPSFQKQYQIARALIEP